MATVELAKPNLISLARWKYPCHDGYLNTSNTKICLIVMILSIVVEHLFSFLLATREAMVLLVNDFIMSDRSIGNLDTLNIKIHLFFHIL